MLSFLRSVQLRLRALWRRDQLERDLEDELAYHMEQRRGNGEQVVPFGNATSIREQTRDQWTFVALDNLWRDVRQAIRAMRHNLTFTVVVVLTLALGIGANTAVARFLSNCGHQVGRGPRDHLDRSLRPETRSNDFRESCP